MELAKNELGLQVVERSIDRTELYICDELFITGSAAQIVAITKVDYRPVGKGEMGHVAGKLKEIFSGIVHAENPKYAHWNVEV